MSDQTALANAVSAFDAADATWQTAHTADAAAQAVVATDSAAVTAIQSQITAAQSQVTGDESAYQQALGLLNQFLSSLVDPLTNTTALDTATMNGRVSGMQAGYAAVQADNASIVALGVQLNAAQSTLTADATAAQGNAAAAATAQEMRTAAYQALLAIIQGDANG